MNELWKSLSTTLIPLIPQISHEKRATAARNVNLVSHAWFSTFIDWLLDPSKTQPGEIDNNGLLNKLDSCDVLREGIDYDVMENNLWDAIFPIFKGGPTVLRPLLTSPITNQPRVILRPIKFNILFSQSTFRRTADPEWNVLEFKKLLAAKVKTQEFQLRTMSSASRVLEDEEILFDIFQNCGPDLYLETEHSDSGLKFTTATSLAPSIRSGTASTYSRTPNKVGLASAITSLLQCLAHCPPLYDQCLHTPEIHENVLVNLYVKTICDFGDDRPVSSAGNQLFQTLLTPPNELTQVKHFEMSAILNSIFRSLSVLRIPDLFEFKLETKLTCPKCKMSKVESKLMPVILLDMPKKGLFKKSKLESCIDSYFTTAEPTVCGLCKKQMTPKISVTIQEPPKAIIFSLKRFYIDEQNTIRNDDFISFPTTLDMSKYTNVPAKYNLCAILAHCAQSVQIRYKSFVFSTQHNKWGFMNETKFKVVEGDVFQHIRTAMCLFYVRTD